MQTTGRRGQTVRTGLAGRRGRPRATQSRRAGLGDPRCELERVSGGLPGEILAATLGKYYASDIPAFGARSWTMSIPGTPTGGPFGKNALIYHDEFVATEIGQIGTQFDGPGHIGVHTSKGNFMYNGRMADKVYQRGAGGRVIGMGDNGVEHVAEKALSVAASSSMRPRTGE